MKTTQINNHDDLDVLLLEARAMLEFGGPLEVVLKKVDNVRSITQNASLHKYCENISKGMNAAGITQRELVGRFKKGFELPVTKPMVKEIFREVGKAMFGKESTSELTTIEIQEVYKVVDQRLGEITGIRCEWPSREIQMMRNL